MKKILLLFILTFFLLINSKTKANDPDLVLTMSDAVGSNGEVVNSEIIATPSKNIRKLYLKMNYDTDSLQFVGWTTKTSGLLVYNTSIRLLANGIEIDWEGVSPINLEEEGITFKFMPKGETFVEVPLVLNDVIVQNENLDNIVVNYSDIGIFTANPLPQVLNVSSDNLTLNTSTTTIVSFDSDIIIGGEPAITINQESQIVNDCDDASSKTFCFDYNLPNNSENSYYIIINNAESSSGEMILDSSHSMSFDTIIPNIIGANLINATSTLLTFSENVNIDAVNLINNLSDFLVEDKNDNVYNVLDIIDSKIGDNSLLIETEFLDLNKIPFRISYVDNHNYIQDLALNNLATTTDLLIRTKDEDQIFAEEDINISSGIVGVVFDSLVSNRTEINIPAEINNIDLDFACLLNNLDNGNIGATSSNQVKIINNQGNGIELELPDNLFMQARSSWDGIFKTPYFMASSSIVDQFNDNIDLNETVTVKVGIDNNVDLFFNKAVKINLLGESGKSVAYVGGAGVFEQIEEECLENNQIWADNNLGQNGACFFDDGVNLIIWTKHFTEFISYNLKESQSVGSSGSVINFPKISSEDKIEKVLINNGEKECTSTKVILNIFSNAATTIQVSNSLDFSNSFWENYQKEKNWELEKGNGEKIVYVKFRDTFNNEVITSSSIFLKDDTLVNYINEEKTDDNEDNFYANEYLEKLKNNCNPENEEKIKVFILNGFASMKEIGVGERIGVLNSFINAFPQTKFTSSDWNDVIRIASGEKPQQSCEECYLKAIDEFLKIYQRDVDFNNIDDKRAIDMITYGIRPIQRDLEKEMQAIHSFESIYSYLPVSTNDWNIVRAIAYSNVVK